MCCDKSFLTSWSFSDVVSETALADYADGSADQEPYTYQGLLDAIDLWNSNKMCEKFGNDLNDVAAFLGNTAHESGNYCFSQEALPCGDYTEIDGVGYCKPSEASDFVWGDNICKNSKISVEILPAGTYGQFVTRQKIKHQEMAVTVLKAKEDTPPMSRVRTRESEQMIYLLVIVLFNLVGIIITTRQENPLQEMEQHFAQILNSLQQKGNMHGGHQFGFG